MTSIKEGGQDSTVTVVVRLSQHNAINQNKVDNRYFCLVEINKILILIDIVE